MRFESLGVGLERRRTGTSSDALWAGMDAQLIVRQHEQQALPTSFGWLGSIAEQRKRLVLYM